MKYSLMVSNGFFWEPVTNCVGVPEWISSATWKETERSTEKMQECVCTGYPENQVRLCVVYVMSLWMPAILRREHWSICESDERGMPVRRYIFPAEFDGWDFSDNQEVDTPVKAIVRFRLAGAD